MLYDFDLIHPKIAMCMQLSSYTPNPNSVRCDLYLMHSNKTVKCDAIFLTLNQNKRGLRYDLSLYTRTMCNIISYSASKYTGDLIQALCYTYIIDIYYKTDTFYIAAIMPVVTVVDDFGYGMKLFEVDGYHVCTDELAPNQEAEFRTIKDWKSQPNDVMICSYPKTGND